jgi:hypothetical protein
VPRGRVTLDKMAETIEVLALDPAAKPGAARPLRRRRSWTALAVAGAAAAAALFAVLWSIGLIGPGREAAVREALRDPEALAAVTREVMTQLVASQRGDAQEVNGAFSVVASLRDSTEAADREAFSFLREGEVASALTTLERFGEELAARQSLQEASDAYSRASRIAQFSDVTRALRDAQRAFDLSPHSRTALDNLSIATLLAEGVDDNVALLERVIAGEREPSAFRAFAHALLAEIGLNNARLEMAQRHLALARAEAAPYPNDAFLQAFIIGVNAIDAVRAGDVVAAQTLSDDAARRFSRISGEEWRFQQWPVLIRENAGDWEGAWNTGRAQIAERESLGVPPSLAVLSSVCNSGLGLGRVSEAAPFCRAAAAAQGGGVYNDYTLADLAAAERRIADGRRHIQHAIAHPEFDNDRITIIYFDMAFAAYAGDFAEAEAKLTIARGILDSDIPEAPVRAQQLAYFTRWLGLREAEAHRLAQACPLLAEAASSYRTYGSARGVEAVQREIRRARCPR